MNTRNIPALTIDLCTPCWRCWLNTIAGAFDSLVLIITCTLIEINTREIVVHLVDHEHTS